MRSESFPAAEPCNWQGTVRPDRTCLTHNQSVEEIGFAFRIGFGINVVFAGAAGTGTVVRGVDNRSRPRGMSSKR